MSQQIANKLGRFAQFGLAASRMAVENAGIDFRNENPHRMGVFIELLLGDWTFLKSATAFFMEKD